MNEAVTAAADVLADALCLCMALRLMDRRVRPLRVGAAALLGAGITCAARRLGLENIRPQVRDAAKRNESVEGAMDAVLVDAPCSGLGVMGDKPDIKYRLSA